MFGTKQYGPPIQAISDADAGRIAVSRNGAYRITFHSVEAVEYTDDKLRVTVAGYNHSTMSETDFFRLIGGGLEMFWEDEITVPLQIQIVDTKPTFELDITKVAEVSRDVQQRRTVESVALYLNVEAGEAGDCIVNPEKAKEHVIGECADVIICAIDLALVHAHKEFKDVNEDIIVRQTLERLNEAIQVKTQKWADKHGMKQR